MINRELFEKSIELSALDETRLVTINNALKQTYDLDGEVWECGVYKGGTSLYIALHTHPHKIIRLFDTFEGMPIKGEFDTHEVGSMVGSSLNEVSELLKDFNNTFLYKGIIPITFKLSKFFASKMMLPKSSRFKASMKPSNF